MEFARWETPFENAQITIERLTFDEVLTVWVRGCREVYKLTFTGFIEFRLMDEVGFAYLKIPKSFYDRGRIASLQLKGADWPNPLQHDRWRHLIVTDDDCLDICANRVMIEVSEDFSG